MSNTEPLGSSTNFMFTGVSHSISSTVYPASSMATRSAMRVLQPSTLTYPNAKGSCGRNASAANPRIV